MAPSTTNPKSFGRTSRSCARTVSTSTSTTSGATSSKRRSTTWPSGLGLPQPLVDHPFKDAHAIQLLVAHAHCLHVHRDTPGGWKKRTFLLWRKRTSLSGYYIRTIAKAHSENYAPKRLLGSLRVRASRARSMLFLLFYTELYRNHRFGRAFGLARPGMSRFIHAPPRVHVRMSRIWLEA